MEYANNGDLKDKVTEAKQKNEFIEIDQVYIILYCKY